MVALALVSAVSKLALDSSPPGLVLELGLVLAVPVAQPAVQAARVTQKYSVYLQAPHSDPDSSPARS